MADPILSLEAAKLHLRVDSSAEDSLITDAVAAAQGFIEDTTVLVLTRRTVVETPSRLFGAVELRSWPIASVNSISYLDRSGATQQIVTGGWFTNLAARPVSVSPIVGTRWPLTAALAGAISISVTAGYATPADVPPAVMQAVKLLTSHFYTNRNAVEVGARAVSVEVQLAVADLLRKWKRKVI